MIFLNTNIALDADLQGYLEEAQNKVNSVNSLDFKIKLAKELFKIKNTNRNSKFLRIRNILNIMCTGNQRCPYCEDSAAVQIDHLKPKTIFPEYAFVWNNYIPSCGECNMLKGDSYAVVVDEQAQVITSREQLDLLSNQNPTPMFLNLREEDPMMYSVIDIGCTYRYVITSQPGTEEFLKIDYTLATLKLNHQDSERLNVSRKIAFTNFYYRIRFLSQELDNLSPGQKANCAEQLKQEPHQSVWQEIKRMYRVGKLTQIQPGFSEFIDTVPEVLNW